MKKYVNPEIMIKSFRCENVLTASAPTRDYIPEIETLQTNLLGDTPAQFKQRMESFNNLIEFSS